MSKIIPLQDDDFLVSCLLENKNINNKHIVVVNSLGYAYAFRFDELKELSLNAAGVKAMNIDVGEKIAGICVFDKEKDLNNLFLLTSSSGMKRMHYSEIPILNRPSKGKSIFLNVKSNPSTIDGVHNINLSDLIHCIDETQKINFIKPSDIPIGDKQTRLSKISNKKLINTSVIHFNKSSNENFIFQEKEKN
jgi:DNA gyrase/topoisomerase IV subunit A